MNNGLPFDGNAVEIAESIHNSARSIKNTLNAINPNISFYYVYKSEWIMHDGEHVFRHKCLRWSYITRRLDAVYFHLLPLGDGMAESSIELTQSLTQSKLAFRVEISKEVSLDDFVINALEVTVVIGFIHASVPTLDRGPG